MESKKWLQLDLLGFLSQRPAKASTKPSYTITRNPITGYKVVLAPGLTSASPRNPCLSCPDFGKDMDACSSNCTQTVARSLYMQQIGFADVAAVSTVDGSYGIGS